MVMKPVVHDAKTHKKQTHTEERKCAHTGTQTQVKDKN